MQETTYKGHLIKYHCIGDKWVGYSDEAGRGYRSEAGRCSDVKPATVPI